MMERNMKITIITITFNSEKTLCDTFDSILSQSFFPSEYIIVDGASNDNTLELIKVYKNKFLSHNIDFKVVSEQDEGIYDAINKGIRLSNGDIIGILNSDDFLSDDNTLQFIVDIFERNNIECMYGNVKYINDNRKVVRDWKSSKYKKGLFEKSWTPPHQTFYVRKEVYSKYGLYKTNYKIASDVDLMFRFLEIYKIKSKYVDRYIATMRLGGVSSSGLKSTLLITKEIKSIFEENDRKLNMFKYLFYKVLKIKQFIIMKNRKM